MTRQALSPLRDLPPASGWRRGDVLVLFGELFGRGYANGLLDAARRAGMSVVGATVGRRDGAGPLRPLSSDELASAESSLGGPIVNVPLEAGFDLEPAGDGPSPVELLKGVKPDAWQTPLDWDLLTRSREAGAAAPSTGTRRPSPPPSRASSRPARTSCSSTPWQAASPARGCTCRS